MKHNPEKENFAMWPYPGRLAHFIHIRVTFNSFTRYKVTLMLNALVFIKDNCLSSTTPLIQTNNNHLETIKENVSFFCMTIIHNKYPQIRRCFQLVKIHDI